MNESKSYNVAVVGATGAVGEAMLSILADRNFPARQVFPLASERSAGKSVQYNGSNLRVGNLAEFDFSTVEIGLFSAVHLCPGCSHRRRPTPAAWWWTTPRSFDTTTTSPW